MYLYVTVYIYIVSKNSPRDEIPMNLNPAYKMMNPESPKEPTNHDDYENVVQPRPISMTSNPAYAVP